MHVELQNKTHLSGNTDCLESVLGCLLVSADGRLVPLGLCSTWASATFDIRFWTIHYCWNGLRQPMMLGVQSLIGLLTAWVSQSLLVVLRLRIALLGMAFAPGFHIRITFVYFVLSASVRCDFCPPLGLSKVRRWHWAVQKCTTRSVHFCSVLYWDMYWWCSALDE